MRTTSYNKNSMKKFIYWLPRILAVAFVCFISVFALDAFDTPQWPVALFMHLIPSFVLCGATVLAWKRPYAGSVLFIFIGGLFAFFMHSILLAVPAFIIGITFWVSKKFN
jgi:hypothetical protein